MDILKAIECFNTQELFDFFARQDFLELHLDKDNCKNLNKSKFCGTSFLICKQKDLLNNGLEYFPALAICKLRSKSKKGIYN